MEAVHFSPHNKLKLRQPLGLYLRTNISRNPLQVLRLRTYRNPKSEHHLITFPKDVNVRSTELIGLSCDVQNSLHKVLHRIYLRNNNGYQNPELIARSLLNGYNTVKLATTYDRKKKALAKKQKTVTTPIGHSDTTVQTTTSIRIGSEFVSVHGDATRIDFVEENFELTDSLLHDLQEINDARSVVNYPIALIIFNTKEYLDAIPSYIAPLRQYLVQYYITFDDFIPSSLNPYLHYMYKEIVILNEHVHSKLVVENIIPKDSVIFPRWNITPSVKAKLIKNKNVLMAANGETIEMRAYIEDDFDRREVADTVVMRCWKGISEYAKKNKMSFTNVRDRAKLLMIFGFSEDFPMIDEDSRVGIKLPLGDYEVVSRRPTFLIETLRSGQLLFDQFIKRAIQQESINTKSDIQWRPGDWNILGITAGKGGGKTTFAKMVVAYLEAAGVTCSMIDSDDYGMWLRHQIGGNHETLVGVELPPVTADNCEQKDEDTIFSDIMHAYLKNRKIKSVRALIQLKETGDDSIFAEEFRSLIEPCFGRGPGSLFAYTKMRLSIMATRNVVVLSHHNWESVRMAQTELNVILLSPWRGFTATIARTFRSSHRALSEVALGMCYSKLMVYDVTIMPTSVLRHYIV
ncbi:p72 [Dendrolimus punctatus cypovirus 22]|uniref:p72 n=1 Tax=Dendrolimus punctatus cypovirus 22 TaxID=1577776 RepID=UPI00053FCE15|nr:p72 [Dendrolimus punctatus cypovirus 22]AIY60602.1 p72 [Dendrolimus punctatus cypovirus 22]